MGEGVRGTSEGDAEGLVKVDALVDGLHRPPRRLLPRQVHHHQPCRPPALLLLALEEEEAAEPFSGKRMISRMVPKGSRSSWTIASVSADSPRPEPRMLSFPIAATRPLSTRTPAPLRLAKQEAQSPVRMQLGHPKMIRLGRGTRKGGSEWSNHQQVHKGKLTPGNKG